VKDPYSIIVKPHITEKSVAMSYGSDRIKDETELVRKYTFIVNRDANKIEIKQAIETIYNKAVNVTNVRTIKVLGKKRRRGQSTGYEPDRKKAVITLAKGQILEDYGV
jgi:large subunit ribosomal protein L23